MRSLLGGGGGGGGLKGGPFCLRGIGVDNITVRLFLCVHTADICRLDTGGEGRKSGCCHGSSR